MRTLTICLCVLFFTSVGWAQDWWLRYTVSEMNRDVVLADLDGDGAQDLVSQRAAGSITWVKNVGDGTNTWIEHQSSIGLNSGNIYCAGDIDQDGSMDLMLWYYSWNLSGNSWMENVNGDGSDWIEHIVHQEEDYASDYCPIKVCDFDSDSDQDVIGRGFWWENTGDNLTWIQRDIPGFTSDDIAYDVHDMDSDGDYDILGYVVGEELFWIENIGNFDDEWIRHQVYDNSASAIPADINNDGRVDIVIKYGDGDIYWFENSGYDWIEHRISFSLNCGFMGVADLDLDGDIDAFGYRRGYGYPSDVYWFENLESDGLTWESHLVHGHTNLSGGIHAGDIDGDLDQDIVAYNGDHQQMEWFVSGELVGVPESRNGIVGKPESFEILPLWPNPFNASASFSVALPAPSELSVWVYNIAGQKVVQLVDGSYGPGIHTFNIAGESLATGTYFIHAQVPGKLSQTQKIVLMK